MPDGNHVTNPYIRLLKENKNYRYLFCGLGISLLGDWLSLIAIFTAVKVFITEDSSILAWILVLKQIPFLFMAPISGSAADRFNRKHIMILADLARATVVLGFLLIPFFPSRFLVYLIVILQTCLATFFEPARTAIVPDLVSKEQLLTASALGAMLWSGILALGAGLGGPITEFFGWRYAIILDACSYLISAFFIMRINYSSIVEGTLRAKSKISFNDIKELLNLFKTQKLILRLALTKGLYGIGGAMYLMMTVFGLKIYNFGKTAAMGVSALYIARGAGAFFGPILARRLSQSDKSKMHFAIVYAILACSIFYCLFGLSQSIWLAVLCIFFAHMGGSIVWVFSTVLLQIEVPREIRGRVFGFELGLFTLTTSISTLIYSYFIDYEILDPRTACIVMGASWLLAVWVVYHTAKLAKAAKDK